MKTHTGQCTSLSIYYKILANELGTEAYIALAPNHMYVNIGRWQMGKHRTDKRALFH